MANSLPLKMVLEIKLLKLMNKAGMQTFIKK